MDRVFPDYGRSRLPYDLLIYPPCELPTEIWERIIDWMCVEPQEIPITSTLHACALVCRAWRDRSRLHLYRSLTLQSNNITKFFSTLRRSPNFSMSSIQQISITCFENYPLSSLLFRRDLDALTYLEILHLNLAREHPQFMKSPMPRTVRTLDLWGLREWRVSSLIRFINTFHSLTSLTISDTSILDHKEEMLPPLNPVPNRQLLSLTLELAPGMNKILEFYVLEGVFLSHLKSLSLQWWSFPDKYDHHTYFDGAKSLLDHCRSTLEHLTLNFEDVPMIDEVSDICKPQCVVTYSVWI